MTTKAELEAQNLLLEERCRDLARLIRLREIALDYVARHARPDWTHTAVWSEDGAERECRMAAYGIRTYGARAVLVCSWSGSDRPSEVSVEDPADAAHSGSTLRRGIASRAAHRGAHALEAAYEAFTLAYNAAQRGAA